MLGTKGYGLSIEVVAFSSRNKGEILKNDPITESCYNKVVLTLRGSLSEALNKFLPTDIVKSYKYSYDNSGSKYFSTSKFYIEITFYK